MQDLQTALFCYLKGQEVEGEDCSGALCIRKPWPGVARSIYGDHQRYVDTYFKPGAG